MAYRFSHTDSTIEDAFRRIAQEQIGGAAARLESAGDDIGPAVHEARKAIKKTRALLRLLRPGFAKFRTENAALRDAGRVLAPLRSSHVGAALLDEICAEARVDARRMARATPADTGLDPDAALASAAAALGDVAQRAPAWHLLGNGFEVLRTGLARGFASAADHRAEAFRRYEPEAMHEFRKRVKHHWYHARMLVAIWPEMMQPHIAAANALGKKLGDHHDLAELRGQLGGDQADVDAVAAVIRTRSEQIETEARILAQRLFSDDGEALASRWTGWWKAADAELPVR